MSWLREAFEWAAGNRRPDIVEVAGKPYATGNLKPVHEPTPVPIRLHGLDGIIAYLNGNRDNVALELASIIVDGPTRVRIVGSVDVLGFKLRDTWAEADIDNEIQTDGFNQWKDLESFVIWLQTAFVQDDATAAVLKLVGNITDKAEVHVHDDGITQSVTAKAGIARVEDVAVPNPVTLRPYRTFLEVPQPAGKFVLRVRRASGTGSVTAGLFQADGGLWKLEAIAAIAAYLREHAPKQVQVIA